MHIYIVYIYYILIQQIVNNNLTLPGIPPKFDAVNLVRHNASNLPNFTLCSTHNL